MRSMWPVIVSVAAAFTLVIGFGFLLQGSSGRIPDEMFGVLGGVAIPVTAGALYCLLTGTWPSFSLRRAPRKPIRAVEGIYLRALRQDAYDADPTQTVSCAHLAPIELAMRAAGFKMRLSEYPQYGPVVSVDCRINLPELQRVFDLPESVYYKEAYQPERSSFDNPRADIFCRDCLESDRARCGIQVLHPEECRPGTRWFPQPGVACS